jgi:hypothetical protein
MFLESNGVGGAPGAAWGLGSVGTQRKPPDWLRCQLIGILASRGQLENLPSEVASGR